jgi:arabinose-5-phosphate isomerase
MAYPEQKDSALESLLQHEPLYLAAARQTIDIELEAIQNLIPHIDNTFIKACALIAHCKNRVVVIGMGKSGHIGNKIAATLASTGTPAFFLHPAEACHGDIGMLTHQDVVLALSYSGTTDEIIALLPAIHALHLPLIAITGNPNSILAQTATVHLPILISKEACHLGLAPTASTTATLVLGDALAIAVAKAKGFSASDFARSHPNGQLGRQLLLKVSDIMKKDKDLAIAHPDAKLLDVLPEMSSKALGMLAIVDEAQHILGIYTDGDLRRTLNQGKALLNELHNLTLNQVMRHGCITVPPTLLAFDAWIYMRDNKINGLLVASPDNTLVGMLNIHTLLQAKVISA